MVEQVEELGPEFDTQSFAYVRLREDGEVEVIDSRSSKYGVDSRFGTRSVIWRWREATGVKPLAQVAAAGFLIAPRNHIRPDVADSKICGFQCGLAGLSNLQRE